MSKKLTLVYQYYGTDESLWSTRWWDYTQILRDKGYTVRVITSNFVRSDLPKIGVIPKKIVLDGIEVLILPFGDGNNHKKLKRLANSIGFALLSTTVCLFRKHDVLVCSSGPITAAVPLIFASSKIKVMEVRDLWPHGAFNMNKIPKYYIIEKILYGLENIIYSKSRFIVTCSPAQSKYLFNKKGYLVKDKLVSIEHGIDDRILAQYQSTLSQNEEYNIKYWVVVATMGYIHNPMKWVSLAKRLRSIDNNIVLVMIGGGPLFDEVKEMISRENLDNIILTGQVSKIEVSNWLMKSEFALFTTLQNEIQLTSAPNKIYDYLSFEIPILIDLNMWLLDAYGDVVWLVDFDSLDGKDIERLRSMKSRIPKDTFIRIKKELNRNYILNNFLMKLDI